MLLLAAGSLRESFAGITCVVLPVRQASKPYAFASGLLDAARAGLLVSRSGSATCRIAAAVQHGVMTAAASVLRCYLRFYLQDLGLTSLFK